MIKIVSSFRRDKGAEWVQNKGITLTRVQNFVGYQRAAASATYFHSFGTQVTQYAASHVCIF
jgi:hypothetical protein